jgi:hypothetical protein
METINIYDVLHLLNLIKNRSHVNFGGNLAFAHVYVTMQFYFIFSLKEVKKGS